MSGFDVAKQKVTTLNDDIENILDEVERGVYKRPIDVFDRFFDLIDDFSTDFLAVLGDLQKTHILVDREKLKELMAFFKVDIHKLDGYSRFKRYIRKGDFKKWIADLLEDLEKAEKLLETQRNER